MDIDEITGHLCYGKVEWEMTHSGAYKLFKVGLFNADAKAWYAFVATRLDPVKHISDVTLDRAKLVYAIMLDKTMDIGCLIYSRLMYTMTPTSTGIWFPSLVTALCRQAGVVISVEETERPRLQPIERVSQSRYTYRLDAQDRVQRMEREFWNPSPLHGNPGVARKRLCFFLFQARERGPFLSSFSAVRNDESALHCYATRYAATPPSAGRCISSPLFQIPQSRSTRSPYLLSEA